MKHRRTFLRVLGTAGLALGIGIATAAAQDNTVARVDALTGSATVERSSGTKQALTASTVLGRGDTVMTDKGARVRLRFSDGATVTLGEDTSLKVARYTHNAGAGERQGQLDLVSGAVRAIVPKLSSPRSRFDIHTPTAVAAVRSTDWMIEHTDKNETHVFVGDGAVAVTSRGAQLGRVVLEAGWGTTVAKDVAPQPPRVWGAPRIANLRQRTDLP